MQDFFENAQPRVVAMMLIGIVLLVAVVEITYLLWPQVKRIANSAASHAVLQEAAASGRQPGPAAAKIDTEVQDLSRQLHGDMARLPAKQMESFVIGRLQKVSWDTDVELLSVQPGSGKQVQNFRESLFEVSAGRRVTTISSNGCKRSTTSSVTSSSKSSKSIRTTERTLDDPEAQPRADAGVLSHGGPIMRPRLFIPSPLFSAAGNVRCRPPRRAMPGCTTIRSAVPRCLKPKPPPPPPALQSSIR